jgi:hypothetical protein
MNFTPLDSSRQRSSFEIKIFSQKNYFFFLKKIFGEAREESNGAKFIAVSRLIKSYGRLKFQNFKRP